jgi:hypothetical protein
MVRGNEYEVFSLEERLHDSNNCMLLPSGNGKLL